MFEHSVKVPRHYKIAANIFKKVYTEGGSVKTLLYDDKLKHFRTNVLYALITETIKHAVDIEKIFESCDILTKEPRLDPWLAKVLTAELLFGKKALPGKSKPEQTILSYKEQFEKSVPEQQDASKSKVVPRPRYVRINTNLLATSDAIRAFQDEGYKFIRCTSGSYTDYLQQIQNLTEYDFTQDYHVKTMFVFAPGTKMYENDLYLENQIVLQDKATALAVHLLAPPPDSVVLDMCAAPGMKTTQAAAYIRNQGKIYAVERNEKRYQILCDFVEKTGSKCVETLHKDSLEIKRGDCDDVEYILLDPSCSGSGMDLHVHNYIEETRLARLTSLQEKFLKHAMNSFPKAKRIVYSTCSLFPEENERVITNVVKTSRAKWRVQDAKELLKGQWNNFGSGMYGSMGTRCLYAVPDSDLTTGFFLAVLDRDEKCHGENNVEAESIEKKTKKFNKNIVDDKIEIDLDINNTEEKHKSKKKHKKEHNNTTQFEESTTSREPNVSEVIDEENKTSDEIKLNGGRKKKRAHTENNQEHENGEINEVMKQKRQKNKKKCDLETLSNYDNILNNTERISEGGNENIDEVTKKKKKRKIKDVKSTNLISEEINNIETPTFESTSIESNSHGCNSELKKKNKKRKAENISELLQNDDINTEKKSNNTEINDHINENLDHSPNNGESIKIKKKKKKDKVRDQNDNCEAFYITETIEDHEKPKRKKKKKENSNLDAAESIADDTLIKKKKSKYLENSEILEDNHLSEDVFKKKKKKIKEL